MKVRYKSPIEESVMIPKENMLYRWNRELFYVFKDFSSYEYIAIPVEIDDRIIDFKERIFIVRTDDRHELTDIKIFNVEDEAVKNRGYSEDSIFWNLLIGADLSSVNGRNAILENFVYGYDSKIGNLPSWMVEPTPSVDLTFTREIEYKNDFVKIEEIAGSNHPSYQGHSWYEIFLKLKREKNLVYGLYKKEYYDEIQEQSDVDRRISYIKIDNQYFINTGNHRSTIAKIMGKEKIYAGVTFYKTDYSYKNAYNKLLSLGFEVEFIDDRALYIFKDEYDIDENWEAFILKFGKLRFTLYGIDMIEEFIDRYECLGTKKYQKVIRFLKTMFETFNYEELEYLDKQFRKLENEFIHFKKIRESEHYVEI